MATALTYLLQSEASELLNTTPCLATSTCRLPYALKMDEVRRYVEDGVVTWTREFIDGCRYFIVSPPIEETVCTYLKLHDDPSKRAFALELGVLPPTARTWGSLSDDQRYREGVVWGLRSPAISTFARFGHLSAVEYLLGRVTPTDAQLSNILAACCNTGQLEIVKFICAGPWPTLGAYPRAVWVAALKGRLSVLRYLVEECNVTMAPTLLQALQAACESGHLPVVQYLIGRGVDSTMYGESSCLREASSHGHLDVVAFLLDHGEDIHAFADAAVREASQHGRLAVVQYLVEHGASFRIWGDKALALAGGGNHLDVVQYLVAKGADPRASGDALFRSAIFGGAVDVVRFTLDHGASVDHYAGLRIAAYHGHLSVVTLLVERGANIHIEHDYPLRMACVRGHRSIVDYLLNHGADISHCGRGTLRAMRKQGRHALIEHVRNVKRHGYVSGVCEA